MATLRVALFACVFLLVAARGQNYRTFKIGEKSYGMCAPARIVLCEDDEDSICDASDCCQCMTESHAEMKKMIAEGKLPAGFYVMSHANRLSLVNRNSIVSETVYEQPYH